MPDIGYYTLPVILSFKEIDAAVNADLGKSLQPVAKKAGEDLGKSIAEGAKSAGKPIADAITKPVVEATKKTGETVAKQITKPIIESTKKTGADVGKAIDAEVTKATKTTGDKVGKQISDSVAKSTKGSGGLKQVAIDAAKEFGKGFESGILSGVVSASSGGRLGEVMTTGLTDSLKGAVGRTKIGQTLGGELVGGLIDGISDELSHSDIGRTITSTLNTAGLDIAGPVSAIVGSLDPLKRAIGDFKKGDLAGGLGDAVEILRNLEKIGIPPEIATTVGDIASNLEAFGATKDNIDAVVGNLKTFADSAPGMKGKLEPFIATLGELSGPLAVAAIAEQPAMDADEWARTHIPIMAWLDKYTPDKLSQMAHDRVVAFFNGLNTPTVTVPSAPNVNTPLVIPPSPTSGHPTHFGGRAGGGPIYGGTPGKDSVPILAQMGEHMLDVGDVAAMGGHANVYRFRAALHMDQGGGISPEIQAVQQIAQGFHLNLISGYRSPNGPTIAGVSAGKSYHGSGQAGDFSNGDQTKAELDFATYMFTNYGRELAELIHDQKAWFHNVNNGQDVGPMGAFYTTGQAGYHGDHVHVAVKRGTAPDLVPGSKPLVPAGQNASPSAPTITTSPGSGGSGGANVNAGNAGGGAAAAAPDITGQFQKTAQQDLLNFASKNIENAVSGIKETLGLGDVFPDPTATPLFQSLLGGGKAFLPLLEGAMKGKLGIQQPGWHPGMPVDAMSQPEAAGSGLSLGLPFGLPSIDLPAAPPGPDEHAGSGAAPGPVTQNNDMSIVYNGPVGSDPAEVQRQNSIQHDKAVSRVTPVMPDR